METRALKTAVGFICAYEMFAIVSHRVPTISSLCRHHRSVEAALLGVLIVHLHHKEKA